MSDSPLFSSRRWLMIPFGAALFIAGLDYGRMQQVGRIRDFDRGPAAGAQDYSGGRHWLVVPEHNNRSYQWLLETEQMLTLGPGRVHHITRENAPEGRTVHAASLYRWWLGSVAWMDQRLSGRPIGQSLEQAALWAGPVLHLLLLAGSTWLVARRFGAKPAALLSIGLAGLFPLAGEFLPGVPDDHGLAIFFAWGSVLFFIAGLQGHRRSFIFSGVAGGLGLWVSAATQVPVLAGMGIGGLLLAAYDRKAAPAKSSRAPLSPPWATWALAGAATSLLAYFVEYFPDQMEMRLEANHPLYGIAWIGWGQLLMLASPGPEGRSGRNPRILLSGLVALAGLAALPAAMRLLDNPGFLVANPQATRLTYLPNGVAAPNLATWLTREGAGLAKAAVTLPLLWLVAAVPGWLRRGTDPGVRRTVVFTGSIVIACFGLACAQLQWWSLTQLLLVTLLMFAALRPTRWSGIAVALSLLPGLWLLASSATNRDNDQLTRREIEGLVERDIAHWIADHADPDGAVLLASPEQTPGLNYHGGLRGLGSPNWENQDGVAATVRIISATTPDEAQALLRQRGVTHIVLTSWNADLDEFVRWTMPNPNDAFLTALHRWALPPWLQPLPYPLPKIGGFENETVVILKITENSDRALALSRMLEYFLETQDLASADSTNEVLKTFPANLGALIGRAQYEKARGEPPAFDPVFATIQQSLTNGLDRLLPWDRRVSLAIVLAQGGRNDLAKLQLQRSLGELDETRLRALGPGALYRLLVLAKAFDLTVKPALRDRALSLLPAEARRRL